MLGLELGLRLQGLGLSLGLGLGLGLGFVEDGDWVMQPTSSHPALTPTTAPQPNPNLILYLHILARLKADCRCHTQILPPDTGVRSCFVKNHLDRVNGMSQVTLAT